MPEGCIPGFDADMIAPPTIGLTSANAYDAVAANDDVPCKDDVTLLDMILIVFYYILKSAVSNQLPADSAST